MNFFSSIGSTIGSRLTAFFTPSSASSTVQEISAPPSSYFTSEVNSLPGLNGVNPAVGVSSQLASAQKATGHNIPLQPNTYGGQIVTAAVGAGALTVTQQTQMPLHLTPEVHGDTHFLTYSLALYNNIEQYNPPFIGDFLTDHNFQFQIIHGHGVGGHNNNEMPTLDQNFGTLYIPDSNTLTL
jgi:hypothetical protein